MYLEYMVNLFSYLHDFAADSYSQEDRDHVHKYKINKKLKI